MGQMIEAVESDKGGRALEILQPTGLDAPILGEDDRRWRQLQCDPPPRIDLRDRFRGAMVGGAIGDAMAGRTQARGRVSFL